MEVATKKQNGVYGFAGICPDLRNLHGKSAVEIMCKGCVPFRVTVASVKDFPGIYSL